MNAPTSDTSLAFSPGTRDEAEHPLSRLIPPELAYFLEDRPLTGHEDPAKYDALLTDLVLSYDARDTIEFVLVKGLADEQWQANRLRRTRQGIIELLMPETAWNMLRASWMEMRYPAPSPQTDENAEEEPDELDELLAYEERQRREHQARNDLTRLIRLSLQGNLTARQGLEEIMEHACVTHDMLHTSTLLSCIARLSQLEDMLILADKRRDQLMRMIEDRRRTNAVMTRSLLRQDTRASATDVAQEDEGGASE